MYKVTISSLLSKPIKHMIIIMAAKLQRKNPLISYITQRSGEQGVHRGGRGPIDEKHVLKVLGRQKHVLK